MSRRRRRRPASIISRSVEYRAGKYPEEDYAAQRASLENEAAAVLSEMDALRAERAY
jgi:hypothetical protein